MVLTRRGSAQLETAATRPSSSAANNRSTRLPHHAPSPAVDTSRPCLPLDSPIPSASFPALPFEMHVPTEASFEISRRPSDEWREFFNLDRQQSTDRPEAEQSSEGMKGSKEGAETVIEEQGAPWTTVFPGGFAFGEASPTPPAAPSDSFRMYPQRLARGSFESASSISSSVRDLDSLPSHSAISSAPTSLAASPMSTLDSAASPLPSVLQAAPATTAATPRASPHPSVSSVLLSGGYSSIMPRRSPAAATTTTKIKPRKARKSKSGVEASNGAEGAAAYTGGSAQGSHACSFSHESVNASVPHSTPPTTTTFSCRLAYNEDIVKKIKVENQEEFNFIPPTPASALVVAAEPVLSKASIESVDDIAPAVASAPAPRPRKPKVRPEGHTPRPPNAWILYRSAQIQILKADKEISKKPQSDISKLIGYMWRDEAPEVRKYYEEQAALKKAEHIRLYPDYTFCPVRKPKAGGVASASSSRASTPAHEPSGSVARPAIARRATAPSSRTTPYSPRKRRVTSDTDFASQTVTVHMPPSVLGLDFGLSNPLRSDNQAFVPHSAGSYQSDFALECGMDALFTSFSQSMPTTPVGAFSMSASPSVSSFPAYLDATASINIDYNGNSSTDPAAYAAWTTFEATSPNYFPEHSPLDLLPQAPMSAPAAYSTFNFGPVPSIFDPRPLHSPTTSRSSGFVPAVGSVSTSASFPMSTVDTNGLDMTSPTTNESSLASPTDARFPYEQWMPAPMEMQWEGAEGACGDVNGEAEYKRRFSTQWMAPQAGSQTSYYSQPGMQDYSFPSSR